MKIIRTILTNGYIPMIPILIWNIVFASKLPPAYEPKSFSSNIPLLILSGENLFRLIIFTLPIFFKINISTVTGKLGLVVYIFGSFFYYISWLLLIYAPNSLWSNSVFGFAAPAYTIIIWLLGISLMVDSYYFKITYAKWHFIIPSIAFLIFHVTHSFFAFFRSH